jgi:ribosomal protein S28E/S33
MSTDNLRGKTQRCVLIAIACIAASPAFAQRGAMTVPRNLEQMVAGSADIVRGTVLSARVEKHPELTNLDTLVVTLKVHEAIKGGAHGTYTFRQYLWDLRDVRDAAGYYKGQEYVLLMNAPSRYGLTSPAGSGHVVAVNGRGNTLLMRGVAGDLAKSGTVLSRDATALVAKHQKGPIRVDDLVRLIRELARESG